MIFLGMHKDPNFLLRFFCLQRENEEKETDEVKQSGFWRYGKGHMGKGFRRELRKKVSVGNPASNGKLIL